MTVITSHRITGHTVHLDVLGYRSLTHPISCTLLHRPYECPVQQAINKFRVRGRIGTGTYEVALDDDGYAHLYTPGAQDFDPSFELTAILDAAAEEVGAGRIRYVINEWLRNSS